MEKNQETFTYTYSAAQQEEIKNIRKKYAAPEENKMEQLRCLDHLPSQKAQAWAIALGVIGALILGTGMSMAMTDFGALVGPAALIVGSIIGVIGMVLVALAYPLYNHILKREQNRVAPEILRLTDELLK